MRKAPLLALCLAFGVPACGTSGEVPFPKEAAVAPPVPAALETATFTLG
jgi:predicted small lipoprotein YifL